MRHLRSRPNRSPARIADHGTDPPSSSPTAATAAPKSPNTNAAEIGQRFDYAAPTEDTEKSAMALATRLDELRIVLPPVGAPLGNYVHAKRVGNLLYLSGKGPPDSNGKTSRGKLGAGVSVEEGYQHARGVGLMLIAAMRDALGGDLDRVEDIVKVLGMVNAAPDFEDHPRVINGCSDLFVEVFGERGRHARSAVGMSSLPGGIPVEIEVIVAVK
jgi:enamine deaminase RidA (YjgF/YER057c/UK114 family)